MKNISAQEVINIAADAYGYAIPMLMGYRYASASFLEPELTAYRSPANFMLSQASTLDHNLEDVVTPNADTSYSIALFNLLAEPVVLQVPPVKERFRVSD